MALVRILIDGYSLLHAWPQLAPGKPRHSEAARDELVNRLTQYRDAVGTPISVIFDGAGPRTGRKLKPNNPEMEVLYSTGGKSADEVIERVAHRMTAYGEVLVVTDDVAERETVLGFGGMASSCDAFITTVESSLAELASDLTNLNRRERSRFKGGH